MCPNFLSTENHGTHQWSKHVDKANSYQPLSGSNKTELLLQVENFWFFCHVIEVVIYDYLIKLNLAVLMLVKVISQMNCVWLIREKMDED